METKQPEDMASEERREIKIEFAPGAFDHFEGTQEELNELIAEIRKSIEDGSLFEKSRPIDIEELMDSDDPDDLVLAERLIRSFNPESDDRKLQ